MILCHHLIMLFEQLPGPILIVPIIHILKTCIAWNYVSQYVP